MRARIFRRASVRFVENLGTRATDRFWPPHVAWSPTVAVRPWPAVRSVRQRTL